jgi:hypothetical protein
MLRVPCGRHAHDGRTRRAAVGEREEFRGHADVRGRERDREVESPDSDSVGDGELRWEWGVWAVDTRAVAGVAAPGPEPARPSRVCAGRGGSQSRVAVRRCEVVRQGGEGVAGQAPAPVRHGLPQREYGRITTDTVNSLWPVGQRGLHHPRPHDRTCPPARQRVSPHGVRLQPPRVPRAVAGCGASPLPRSPPARTSGPRATRR